MPAVGAFDVLGAEGEPKMKKEHWELLKHLADRMAGDTLSDFYRIDHSYNDKWEQLKEAEIRYNSLELTEQSRQAVEALINLREEIDTANTTLAYMAGIVDGAAIMKQMGILEI